MCEKTRRCCWLINSLCFRCTRPLSCAAIMGRCLIKDKEKNCLTPDSIYGHVAWLTIRRNLDRLISLSSILVCCVSAWDTIHEITLSSSEDNWIQTKWHGNQFKLNHQGVYHYSKVASRFTLHASPFTLHASRFPFKLESNPQFQKFCFALLRDRSARKLVSFSRST